VSAIDHAELKALAEKLGRPEGSSLGAPCV
jgi:hypothetical protein